MGMKGQHVTTSATHTQAADPLATLEHICLKHRDEVPPLHQAYFPPITAGWQ